MEGRQMVTSKSTTSTNSREAASLDKSAQMPVTKRAIDASALLEQYGCGQVPLSGSDNALYERHLVFDNIVAPSAAGARERFEAVARSVRDVLSQRWVLTQETYARENPKHVYYMSLEFLIGRSL